ncbi:unnamed protein product [Didymodactylos carnosus]|uniref:Spatacsin C-terminal domain-containing protein n=1 Tax=Didymodactylos carnosus TaxID=1234261 RepID=A0A8S2CS35_9BILA|nr:unnamed protein product [Didymodactylos carnosus]CAF3571340.1 unnamed protein product [Didymodactylos carnosus]
MHPRSSTITSSSTDLSTDSDRIRHQRLVDFKNQFEKILKQRPLSRQILNSVIDFSDYPLDDTYYVNIIQLYKHLFQRMNDHLFDIAKTNQSDIYLLTRILSYHLHENFDRFYTSRKKKSIELLSLQQQMLKNQQQQSVITMSDLNQWKRSQSSNQIQLTKDDIILHCIFNNSPQLLIDQPLKHVFDTGLHNVIQNLADRDDKIPIKLLFSLGLSPYDILYRIIKTTLYTRLRRFCSHYLLDIDNYLTVNEIETLTFIEQLEQIYTSENVQAVIDYRQYQLKLQSAAGKQQQSKNNNKQLDNGNNLFGGLSAAAEQEKKSVFTCQDVVPSIVLNRTKQSNVGENGTVVSPIAYMQLSLSWGKEWSKETQQLLLTEGRQLTVDPDSEEHNKIFNYQHEVDYIFALSRQSLSLFEQLYSSPDKLTDYFNYWSLLVPSLYWSYMRIINSSSEIRFPPSIGEDENLNHLYWSSVLENDDQNYSQLVLKQCEKYNIYPAYLYFKLDEIETMKSDIPWCHWLISSCDYKLTNSCNDVNIHDPLLYVIRNLSVPEENSNLFVEYPALRLLNKIKINPFDVSIYQLLDKYTQIDVAKCFQWQQQNGLSNEQATTSLYDFNEIQPSSPSTLDYRYYFNEQRPLTSYAYFISLFNTHEHQYIEKRLLRLKQFLITSVKPEKDCSSSIVLMDICNMTDDLFKFRLYSTLTRLFSTSTFLNDDLTSISLKILEPLTSSTVLCFDTMKLLLLFNLFCETYSLTYSRTLITYYLSNTDWYQTLFIMQLFQYNIDDFYACLTSTTMQQQPLNEHLKCCFKSYIKQDLTPLNKQDIFALLTDNSLTSSQLKERFQQGALQCSRPLLAVLYSTLPNVKTIDSYVLFLQSLNAKYPHLFLSTKGQLASNLICYLADLGRWSILLLSTEIFANKTRLYYLFKFCHTCTVETLKTDDDERQIHTELKLIYDKFYLTTSTNKIEIGLGESQQWLKQVTTNCLTIMFRQLRSLTDIRIILNLLGEKSEFYRYKNLFEILESNPSPISFDWSCILYTDRCYRSIMILIEQLIKHDRFDIVDEISACMDIEIDITLFKRFKCTFDDIENDNLQLLFETMHNGHQELIKRLKKYSLYLDFLISTVKQQHRENKLKQLLLYIFISEVKFINKTSFSKQTDDFTVLYSSKQSQRSSTLKSTPSIQHSHSVNDLSYIDEKLWPTLIDFVHKYRTKNDLFIEKIFDYINNLFSLPLLDQLLITSYCTQVDQYIHLFDETETITDKQSSSTENTQPIIVPENAFEAALLKNVYPTPSSLNTTTITTTTTTTTTVEAREQKIAPTASYSSSTANRSKSMSSDASSRRTSTSGSSLFTNHLPDQDLRQILQFIQDEFMKRFSPIISFAIAEKYHMITYDLLLYSIGQRICLDILSPLDTLLHLEHLPHIALPQKRLTNILRSISQINDATSSLFQTSMAVNEQKQYLIDLICSRSNVNGDRLCETINTLFKISVMLKYSSFKHLLEECHSELDLLRNLLYLPATTLASYSDKIKLAEQLCKQLQLDNTILCNLIVDETVRTLEMWTEAEQSKYQGGDYDETAIANDCLPFLPNNIQTFQQFISLIQDKNYELIGQYLVERSRLFEQEFFSQQENNRNRIQLSLRVELLIYGHLCFIYSCNMEGICLILDDVHYLAYVLEKLNEFNLLVRLFIGLKQYSEMIYVLDILWNNDKFELLTTTTTSTTMDDTTRLSTSIFDYLKRYHPNDEHLFTLVSMNFTMYQDIACMYQDAAKKLLKTLNNPTMQATAETLTTLQSLIQYYSDASSVFYLAGCYQNCDNCVKQARLCSLQIELLSKEIFIMNLNPRSLKEFLIKHDRFWHSYIVSQAYNEQSYWPQSLFEQFIIKNNSPYYIEYQQFLPITNDLIETVEQELKVLLNENKSIYMLKTHIKTNFQQLLLLSNDIHLMARLAKDLNMYDFIQQTILTKYDNGIYILDTLKL